jgi:RNA polymerase sigma-70 factor (ECF subfamily)
MHKTPVVAELPTELLGDTPEPSGGREPAAGWPRFEQLVRRDYRRLTAQLDVLTADSARARAVAREAFGLAWRTWLRVGELPDAAWIRARAMAPLRIPKRSNRRWTQIDDSFDAVSRLLLEAIDRLPTRQRRALVLHYLAGLPVSSVADELGADEETAELLLALGRVSLSHHLGTVGPAAGVPAAAVRRGHFLPEEWLAGRLALLEQRLEPVDDTEALLRWLLTRTQRVRRTLVGVAAAATLLAGVTTLIGFSSEPVRAHPMTVEQSTPPHQPAPAAR